MRLYVMRHGPAEDRAPSGRDFDRQLTPSGREVVRRVARAFQTVRAASLAAPLRILTSPRVRARETATIVRGAIVPIPSDLELHDALGGEESIPLALITAAAAAGLDTLLVGHQPTVEDLVRTLVAGPIALAGFPTATLVELDRAADTGVWTLVTLLNPAQLPG